MHFLNPRACTLKPPCMHPLNPRAAPFQPGDLVKLVAAYARLQGGGAGTYDGGPPSRCAWGFAGLCRVSPHVWSVGRAVLASLGMPATVTVGPPHSSRFTGPRLMVYCHV